MKLRLNKYIALLITIIVLLSGCSSEKDKVTENYNNNFESKSIKSGNIASNEHFDLLWDDNAQCAILQDKITGYVYSSTPYDLYSQQTSESYINSPIIVTYVDSSTRTLRDANAYIDSISKNGVISKKIKNGVKITYYFPDLEFAVPICIMLCEDGLEVKVLVNQIQENKNQVFKVSVFPYMASAKNDTDSYIFVPSGCGALIDVKSRNLEEIYSEPVYGEDAIKTITMKKNITKSVLLPVFGVKNNQTGMIGTIEKGKETSYIEAHLGNKDMGYSYIYSSFQVRGEDNYCQTSLSGQQDYVSKYSKELIDYKYVSVKYIPMTSKPTYQNMAKEYRNYLQKSGILSNKIKDETNVTIQLFGCVEETKSCFGFPYKSEKSLTTFNQANYIYNSVKEMINDNKILLLLDGFNKSGLEYNTLNGGFKFSGSVGNLNDLSKLKKSVENDKSILCNGIEIVKFQRNGGGFTKKSDAAKGVSKLFNKELSYSMSTALEDKTKSSYYFLSRNKFGEAFDKTISFINKYDINCVNLNSLSNVAYTDYRDIHYLSKGYMSEDVNKYITGLKNNKTDVVVSEPNLYSAVSADYIVSVPMSSSKWSIFREDVPFYELVFKGYKRLYSPAINTTTEPQVSFLKALSLGINLNFSLVFNSYNKINDSEHTGLITSTFDNWKNIIKDMLEKSEPFLKKVRNESITDYEQNNGIIKTVFSDGTTIIVNLTENSINTPNGTINAFSFIYK